MGRAFSLPKLSLRPCLAIAVIIYLPFLIPNNRLVAPINSLELTDANSR